MMRRIRRPSVRWLLAALAALAVVGAGVGAWASTNVTPTYTATTSVLVGSLDRPSIGNDLAASSAITTLYGDLIRGDAVLGPVIERLGLASGVAELRDRVHVDLSPNGIPIITITVYARTAAEATTTAQAIADRMVAMSRASIDGLPPAPRARPPDETDTVVAIASLERRIAQLRARAASVPPGRRGPLEQRIRRQSDLVLLLQTDFRGAAQAPRGSVNELQVLQPAEAKRERIRPILAVDAALGAAIAALAGGAVFVAFAMHRRRGTVRTEEVSTIRDPWARDIIAARQDAYVGTASPLPRR